MKRIMKFLCVSALCMGFWGCDEASNTEKGAGNALSLMGLPLHSAPVELVARETLPEWINDKIDLFLENPLPTSKMRVYKGLWEEETVYCVQNDLSSCLFCDIFFENGESTHGKVGDDFVEKSKNWVLVWQVKVGAETL